MKAQFPVVRMSSPMATPELDEELDVDVATSENLPWMCIVWDDPVNLMSYVTMVFMRHFGYSRDKADQLMLAVHHEGRAVVSRGTREKMEADVVAMHRYGLRATMSNGE